MLHLHTNKESRPQAAAERARARESENSLPPRRCLLLAVGLASAGWALIGGAIAAVVLWIG